VGPVLIAGPKRLLDEQTPEARTVNEQIAFNDATVVQGNRCDEAGLPVQRRVSDAALDPLYAALF